MGVDKHIKLLVYKVGRNQSKKRGKRVSIRTLKRIFNHDFDQE